VPNEISLNYGYGYAFRISGGGPSAPPLVAGTNPPAQYAAPGTSSLVFSFPAATGGTAPITYSPPALTAPPGSGASVSGTAPGNITVNDAVDGESYLVRVYATDADGQQVLNDAIGAVEASSPPSLVAGANPPAQYATAGTTSLTFSFPAATGGVGLITYSPPALTAPPGSGASVSGTAPGNITVNDAVDGESYLVRVYATDADGQQVLNDAIGAVEASSPPVLVAGANPPAQYAAAGTASLVFAFPAASGGTLPYVYSAPTLVKPSGSTATVTGTAPGNITINNATDEEAYLIRVVITDANGQQVLNDALGAVGEAAFVPLAPIVAPARQALASTATSASVTFTQPGAPGGMVYSVAVQNVTTGASIVPSSGSGLGAYAFTVANGNDYIVVIEGTALDGQVATAVAEVAVAVAPALEWGAPATVSRPTGSTTATVTWNAVTGGVTPYVYGEPGVIYDSQGGSTTALYSTAGLTTSITGLVNTQVVVLARQVTDAAGSVLSVQAVATVNASAAPLTFASTPANQTLVSSSTSVTLGSWGAASGGTGPYTYAVTDISGGATAISGSGVGPWSAAGLTAGFTYAFLMTATDSLGAKGYSVVTITVEQENNLGRWLLVSSVDFTDADWTAFSTTSTVQSTTAWYETLYAADGTTPRCYLYNNVAATRTITLSPSSVGLQLVNGATTSQPTIGVWPAGWTPILGGARRDAWLIEAVMEGEEPAGATAFVHMNGISSSQTTMATSPGTGLRATDSTSNVIILRAFSYISGFTTSTLQTLTASPRIWRASIQTTIVDSRRHDIYTNVGATDFCEPQAGLRVRVQATSTSMTAVNADVASDGFAWFSSAIADRVKWWMYHDGAATSGSALRLKKLRLLRMPSGSL
jgi:protocatechuate 3,4-dioxygenase beta subunit